MTFVNVGTLGAAPGKRDELVELWDSAEAHRASLALSQVQDAIARARPLLDGTFGGHRFTVVGSPLRD
ncbi:MULTISPECIES: hypothetical protein [Frigoribacterium]|uniref:hypothetical protein n=1 Tax=Frigoribacterium TaxID=96492 RepID=UPI001785B5C7|nr:MULTISPECIES: hypothetical protein [Frigoribacterium]MBD8702845.1 hypothetical protein [Frigoribacterium sp. CFBP 13712]MCJ0700619.1 hypothetical protein [Frigoribacterium faeni]